MPISIQQISYIHPDKEVLFSDLNFAISKGQKLGLVGNNGCGKSTLLQIIAGQLTPSSGVIVRPDDLYYIPQHFGQYDSLTIAQALQIDHKQKALHAILAGDASIENFSILNDDWNIEERSVAALDSWGLGQFPLSYPMNLLSGGEKTRVFLAGMDIHNPSVILMDEPTNHLDIQSQQVLQQALSEYPGSYCIVSHNRSFLDPIVTKVLEFVPGEKPRVYLGNVSDYLEKEERNQALAAAAALPPSGAAEPGAGLDRKARRRMEAEIRQKKTRLLRPLQEKLELLEEEIARLETEKTEITSQLERPDVAADTEAVMELTSRFQQTDRQLETCFTQWADLSEKIEETEARIQEEAERNVSGS